MKWKNWSINGWVLEALDGEVLDEITRHMANELFIVASTGKKYTSLEAAQKVVLKARKLESQEDKDD
jgi:hypothetical protein